MPRERSPGRKRRPKKNEASNAEDKAPAAEATVDPEGYLESLSPLASPTTELPGLQNSPDSPPNRKSKDERRNQNYKVLARYATTLTSAARNLAADLKDSYAKCEQSELESLRKVSDQATPSSTNSAESLQDRSTEKCPENAPERQSEQIKNNSKNAATGSPTKSNKYVKTDFISSGSLMVSGGYSMVAHSVESGRGSPDYIDQCGKKVKNLKDVSVIIPENVTEERFEEILSLFTSEKTEKELFMAIWNLREANRYLKPSLVASKKDKKESEEFIALGRKYSYEKNYSRAIEMYNLAIMAAPYPVFSAKLPTNTGACAEPGAIKSEEFRPFGKDLNDNMSLATAYGNRSAILFKLQHYRESLIDTNLALIYGLSEDPILSQVMRFRQHQCANELKINVKESLPDNVSATWAQLYENLENSQSFRDTSYVTEFLFYPCRLANIKPLEEKEEVPKGPTIAIRHESMPALGDMAALGYNPKKGRTLFAKRAIRPGEVIGMEYSNVSVLLSGKKATHCANCFRKCFTAHPCPDCSKAVFCRIDCWVKGLMIGHARSCSSISSLCALQKGIKDHVVPSLAYEAVLEYGFMSLKENLPQMEAQTKLHPIHRGFDADGFYNSKSFFSLFHLQTLKEELTPKELYGKCVTAFLLVKLLLRTRYFVDKKGNAVKPTQEDIYVVGSVMLRLLMSLSWNSHEIAEHQLVENDDDTQRVEVEGIGAGAYTTISLINNSCTPTASTYFLGKTLILRSLSFMPVGAEITVAYFGSHVNRTLGMRRRRLETVKVDCKCDACIGDWPLHVGGEKDEYVPCLKCGFKVDLKIGIERGISLQCENCNYDYNERRKPVSRELRQWWGNTRALQEAKKRFLEAAVRTDGNKRVTDIDYNVTTNFVELMQKYAYLPSHLLNFAKEVLLFFYTCGF